MNMRTVFLIALLVSSLLLTLSAQADDLDQGFISPPDSARPWVYWFWLNGNITRDGITADLESMKRAGIGGVLIMEVDQGVPKGPVPFMSETWQQLFQHVVIEAQRLGLEVNMNNDAGWNGSGGPWITPEKSMQKVVWTETDVEGVHHLNTVLAKPEAVRNFYRDIAVLAFPATGTFRIENTLVKAGFQVGGVGPATEKGLPNEMVIDRTRIIDLTKMMSADGRITWDVPAGKWTIMRFGHTTTGVENAPAPESGRGLECDKLSREGIEANFAGMMEKLIKNAGPMAGKALTATHIDSWENGAQNWTPRMREEFQKRRGYDLLPLLPALEGRIIESVEYTERFLRDLRLTVEELIAENYAGRMRELAQAHGMRLTIEAYGGPTDDMTYGGRADEPMGEFWVGGGALSTCKEMASAGHTYGKPIIGAESFTAADQEKWLAHPATIKALGDQAFCAGINRFVFHRYAMQPWVEPARCPGMTMGPWGIHFERTQTWWDMVPAWNTYLARCQYLLRQGHFVADLCYVQQETAPPGFIEHSPKGYDYDNCSVETVLTRMTVKDGRLTLPDGMSYRAMVLPEARAMTPELLAKVKKLVETGATVIGSRPVKSPSLSGYPACDARVKQMADELWGDCDGIKVKEHTFGKGRVVCGLSPENVLAQMGTGPDFFSRTRLKYIHRATSDTDLYFVANSKNYAVNASCRFRMTGRSPELWWPDRGLIEEAALSTEDQGYTNVSLSLEPSGSVFVVFRKKATVSQTASIEYNGTPLLSAPDQGTRIAVKKAVYGVLSDTSLTRDVRADVQRIVDRGDSIFQVANLAQNGDPAPQKEKTLVVEYDINGKTFSVEGRDPCTVHLTDDAVQVVINRAVYGVDGDPARTRDMQHMIQEIVNAGESSFIVARLATPVDPAPGVLKYLTLEYTQNGERHQVRGNDSEVISFEMPKVTEQVADVRVRSDGQTVIEAMKPGRYNIKNPGSSPKSIKVRSVPKPRIVPGPWSLHFPPNGGAPESVELDKLISWSEHPDPGVKYFSGTGTYKTTLRIPRGLLGSNHRLYLDLGNVQIMAQVTLNGKDLGILWKPPYRIDISGNAKPGKNTLEVKVANLWINRMIGDEQLPEDSNRADGGNLNEWPQWVLDKAPNLTGRYTFSTWRLWKKDSPLQPSGLIGPVTLQAATVVSIDKGK